MKSFENRDLKCASDVSVMASLGRFDTEFLLYGTAVLAQDGRIYYYASTDEERLYRRMTAARREGCYFLPMICEKKRTQVPSGMRERLLYEAKIALMGRMRAAYETLLPRLQPFFERPANDNAYAMLSAFQERIDGYFDEPSLQLFEGLVAMGQEGKVLSDESARAFMRWCDGVREQMADDPRVHGNILRTFYGFAYEDGGALRYAVGAQKMNMLEKRRQLRLQGALCAPLVQRPYAVSQSHELGGARKVFSAWLAELEDEAFMQWVRILCAMDGVIDQQALARLAEDFRANRDASAVIRYFASLWNGARAALS